MKWNFLFNCTHTPIYPQASCLQIKGILLLADLKCSYCSKNFMIISKINYFKSIIKFQIKMNFEFILKFYIVSALFMKKVWLWLILHFRRGSPLLIGVRSEHKLSTDHIPILYRTGKLLPYIVRQCSSENPVPYAVVNAVWLDLCVHVHTIT